MKRRIEIVSDAAKKKEEGGRAVSETEVEIEEKNGYC